MWTLQDAKNRFSSVVDAALSGKAAVVVVSADEFARLNAVAGAGRGSFIDHLLAFPGGEFERAPAQPRDIEW
jgi:antitoxin Phd